MPENRVGRGETMHCKTGISNRKIAELFQRSLLGLLLITTVVACPVAGDDFLTPDERNWLQQHKENLEVLFGYEAPPNAYHTDDGRYEGLLVDFLREIEGLIGIEFAFRNFETWDALIEYSKTGGDFIIVGIARTDARAEYLFFTDPFIKVPYVIVTRKTRKSTTLRDFVGSSVCTVANYAVNDHIARYFPQIKPIGVADNLEGLRAVSTGAFDAMVVNQMYASYLIENQGITNLKIAGECGYLNRLSVAVSINDPELFKILDKTVDQIDPERQQELYRKWVSAVSAGLSRPVLVALAATAAAVLASVGILWLWLMSLRKQVGKQTRQIRESEAKLRITLNSIGDAVIATDIEGKIILMNPVAEKLTGWSHSQAAGRQLDEVFNILDSDIRKPAESPVDKVIETGEIVELASYALLISKDGMEYKIADSGAPIRNDAGETIGVVLVFRDVTEKLRTEKELLKTRKLESIGVLAGGIAHDFNNILTGLFGNMELAKTELPKDHESYKYIETANQSLQRAKHLTKQLLTFAKGGNPVLETVSMHQVIHDSTQFNLSGSNIKTRINLPDDLWQVKADEGQLGQVIANLAINAKEAMPSGGCLSIKAENIENINESAAPHLSGNFVKLSIRDEGVGISAKHIEKIFDPYFSTKQTGSGLGLAIVHSIITKHNGFIRVDSAPDVGTNITIFLPAEKSSQTVTDLPHVDETPASRSGRILVMDDDEMVRSISAKMIQSFGYSVSCAIDGEETLKKYTSAMRDGNAFDIVIMDLTIPGGMGGKEAVTKLHAIDPEAKVIVSSGYSTDPIMANYGNYRFKGRLVKPFQLDELKRELSRVMEMK